VKFEQSELDEFVQTESLWLAANMDLENCYSRCGMTEEGWVLNEDYESAKKELEEILEEQRLRCEDDEEDLECLRKGWAFRDREEVY
jgi:hypothetical protein